MILLIISSTQVGFVPASRAALHAQRQQGLHDRDLSSGTAAAELVHLK